MLRLTTTRGTDQVCSTIIWGGTKTRCKLNLKLWRTTNRLTQGPSWIRLRSNRSPTWTSKSPSAHGWRETKRPGFLKNKMISLKKARFKKNPKSKNKFYHQYRSLEWKKKCRFQSRRRNGCKPRPWKRSNCWCKSGSKMRQRTFQKTMEKPSFLSSKSLKTRSDTLCKVMGSTTTTLFNNLKKRKRSSTQSLISGVCGWITGTQNASDFWVTCSWENTLLTTFSTHGFATMEATSSIATGFARPSRSPFRLSILKTIETCLILKSMVSLIVYYSYTF